MHCAVRSRSAQLAYGWLTVLRSVFVRHVRRIPTSTEEALKAALHLGAEGVPTARIALGGAWIEDNPIVLRLIVRDAPVCELFGRGGHTVPGVSLARRNLRVLRWWRGGLCGLTRSDFIAVHVAHIDITLVDIRDIAVRV